MSGRSRPNINAALRRRRALRVALGERRFRWRPLDVGRGRPIAGFPRLVPSKLDFLRLAHEWLLRARPKSDYWWFHVEELAFDSSGKYHVVVGFNDVLVYRETLWTGRRDPFQVLDRREACRA